MPFVANIFSQEHLPPCIPRPKGRGFTVVAIKIGNKFRFWVLTRLCQFRILHLLGMSGLGGVLYLCKSRERYLLTKHGWPIPAEGNREVPAILAIRETVRKGCLSCILAAKNCQAQQMCWVKRIAEILESLAMEAPLSIVGPDDRQRADGQGLDRER